VEAFIADYFAAQIRSDDVNTSYVYGDPLHPLMTTADHYSISNSYGAHNQTAPDGFHVLDGGSSLFIYPFADDMTAGISVKNSRFSAILLGFGLEALAGFGGDADSVRADLLTRMLNWLATPATGIDQQENILPQQPGIVAAYPNPFNPEIHFTLAESTDSQSRVEILDLRGRLVSTLSVNRQKQLTWVPENTLTAGVYFACLRTVGKPAGRLVKITFLKTTLLPSPCIKTVVKRECLATTVQMIMSFMTTISIKRKKESGLPHEQIEAVSLIV
jgi:hypothetical protein